MAYGLIPVGSDAWLAKNEVPSAGSIVLVHGNGNEPVGVEKLLERVQGGEIPRVDRGENVAGDRREAFFAHDLEQEGPHRVSNGPRLASGLPARPRRMIVLG